MSVYTEDHLRLLKSFFEHHVKFIVIGGHAAIYYGVNRNTGDLDILVEATAENGNKIIQALRKLSLELPEISPSEFADKLVLSFGLEPDAVDILNYTPGVDFDTAYANAQEVNFNDFKINVIDIHDLIKNKESLNRQNEKAYLDKYDIEILKKILSKSNNPK
jgi:hypothetical protein